MTIDELLELAKNGEHECCEKCVFSPNDPKNANAINYGELNFGINCQTDAFDHNNENKSPLAMLILQDPWAKGPRETGKICLTCNAMFDATALQGKKIFDAVFGVECGYFLRRIYQTNAVLHGRGINEARVPQLAKDEKKQIKRQIDKQRKQALENCQGLLALQIKKLNPRIIITSGKFAFDSFKKTCVSNSINIINDNNIPPGMSVFNWNDKIIFKTFHVGQQALNRHAAPIFDKHPDILDRLQLSPAMKELTELNGQYQLNASVKGMRVMLRHWIYIADAIRSAEASLPK